MYNLRRVMINLSESTLFKHNLHETLFESNSVPQIIFKLEHFGEAMLKSDTRFLRN